MFSRRLTLCEEYLPRIKPVWSLSMIVGRTFSKRMARIFARIFKSRFKTDIGLYEEHSSEDFPFFSTKEILASIRDGGRAPVANEDCSTSNKGLTKIVLNFL